jgi:endonuclease/exonuclease/phosphatase family metal-dependent hydrolase
VLPPPDAPCPPEPRAQSEPSSPPGTRPARPGLRTARRATLALGWALGGGLALLVLGRLAHLDDHLWFYIGVDAYTPVVFLPAYPVLAAALARRRWALGALAAAVVAAHVAWVAPGLWPGSPERAPAGASRLRLMTANLEYNNPTAGALAGQIRAASPDLLVLEELSPLTLSGLRHTGVLAGYRYRMLLPEPGAFGAGVLSRFPLTDVAQPRVAGLLSLRATVHPRPAAAFRLFVVHTPAPRDGHATSRWRAQLADLRRETAATAATGMPVVAAGDFNATEDHRGLRRLLAAGPHGAGLRDAHDVAHAGWTPTWSTSSGPVPPLVRIDHVLCTRQFAVTGYRVGSAYGSDHLPLQVDLALRPAR